VHLITDLTNHQEVQSAHALLARIIESYEKPGPTGTIPPVANPAAVVSTPPIAEQCMTALWPRLSKPVRTILKNSEKFDGEFNLRQLAETVGRPYSSVKATVNGPLARAIKSVRKELPNSPDHPWSWRRCDDGHFELRLKPEIRSILAKLSVDDER